MNSSSSFDLTPLKHPKQPEAFAVCDIEAADWTRFLVIGFYDGTFFHEFRSIEKFLLFVAEQRQRVVFAHFGGIYDFLFILEVCLSRGFRVFDLIPRGSGILCFSVAIGDHVITFRDSSALLPFSLKNLTNTFGVESKKKEIDYEKIKRVTPELLDYLKFDCMGLFQVLERFFASELIKRSGPKYTIASQAIQVLRTFLKSPIRGLAPIFDDFVRKGYAGGRTEIFRPYYKGQKKIHCYDVNSLYPSVMLEEYPNACTGFSSKLDLSKMGFVEGTVKVPEKDYLPILWTKDPNTGRFIFPTGTIRGIWSTLEIQYACSLGAKILDTRRHLFFSNGGPLFRNYVLDLYSRREKSTDDTERTISKLLLNSSYGRMGLRRDREGLEIDSGQENVTPHFEVNLGGKVRRFVKTDVELKSFSNVAIAAYVTAYARIKMHKLLTSVQKDLYYTDTDSLFTTRKLKTGTGLGQLKLEYSENSAVFLLPKTYIVGKKIAMKGFDKKKIQHFTHDDFHTALEGDLRKMRIKNPQRFARLKTALRQGKLVTMSKSSEKSIKSKYDKRIVFFDQKTKKWETRPIVLGNELKEEKTHVERKQNTKRSKATTHRHQN